MKQYKLGVLGAGNMGTAIADGAVRGGFFKPGEVLLFNRTEEKRAEKAQRGYAVTGEYTRVYQSCEWVILGVKPQNFDELLPVLAAVGVEEKPLVISIAAAVSFERMERALGTDQPIIRAMPNTPLMLGCGTTELVGNHAASASDMQAVRALFDSMGTTAVFDYEEAMNDVIPYSGSFPAYVYFIADAMAKSAAQHGIAYETALPLVCQTLIGSAKMLLAGEKTPEELIKAVCSPGGTTIEAVHVLESRDVAGILAEASDKCIARAYEL